MTMSKTFTPASPSPLAIPSPPPSPHSPKSPRSLSFPVTVRTTSDGRITMRRTLLTRDVIDDLTVPKNRRPRFELVLQIHDLNNVPLTTGYAYVKWHVAGSAKRENHGQTERAPVKDHKVSWNNTTTCGVRMTIDRIGMLQETNLVFQVVQEFPGQSAKEERCTLGIVTVNLAEYAKVEKETRRYLMQESKINSTLKVTVALTQISGDNTFTVPRLKSAHIFGAITGVINEQGPTDSSVGSARDDSSTKMTLEHLHYTTSLQDMYRDTLTSQWQAHTDELNADDCIDDIFRGGTGWKMSPHSPPPPSKPKSRSKSHHSHSHSHTDHPPLPSPRSTDRADDSGSEESTSSKSIASRGSKSSSRSGLSARIAAAGGAHSTRSSSSASTRFPNRNHMDFDGGSVFAPRLGMGGNGAGQASRWREQVVERKVVSRTSSKVGSFARGKEVDEMEVREDLKSWVMSAR